MSESRLYKVKADEKNVYAIGETDFCTHGFQERYDIQEWVAKDPSVLGEELLIIAKEFSAFDKTNERADIMTTVFALVIEIVQIALHIKPFTPQRLPP